jgi:hypothetical protein
MKQATKFFSFITSAGRVLHCSATVEADARRWLSGKLLAGETLGDVATLSDIRCHLEWHDSSLMALLAAKV